MAPPAAPQPAQGGMNDPNNPNAPFAVQAQGMTPVGPGQIRGGQLVGQPSPVPGAQLAAAAQQQPQTPPGIQAGMGGTQLPGLTPQQEAQRQATGEQMIQNNQDQLNELKYIKDQYGDYEKQAQSILAARDKSLAALDADQRQRAQDLYNLRMRAAGQERDMDQAMLQWANTTPTRQATYAAAMHAAAPLSILAAIGGAMTRTSALTLLSATNGVIQGINSGAEDRYHAAMDEWKTRYQALQDHLNRVKDINNDLKDAYQGMYDADERAGARTRLLTADQLQTAQLKIADATALLGMQEKVGGTLTNSFKVFEMIENAAWRRATGPMSSMMLDPEQREALIEGGVGGLKAGLTLSQQGVNYRDPIRNEIVARYVQDFERENANNPDYQDKPGEAPGSGKRRMYIDIGIARSNAMMNRDATQAAVRSAGRIFGPIQGSANALALNLPRLEELARYVNNKYKWQSVNHLKTQLALIKSDANVAEFLRLNESARNDYFAVTARSGKALADRQRNMDQLEARDNLSVYLADLAVVNYETAVAERGYRQAMNPAAYQGPPPQLPPIGPRKDWTLSDTFRSQLSPTEQQSGLPDAEPTTSTPSAAAPAGGGTQQQAPPPTGSSELPPGFRIVQ
jgi:hypothetical protein